MAGRKITNEQDARRCLTAAKSSRDGPAAWARAHGVDGRSLNAWRVNLERRGVTRPRVARPKLVELVPAAELPVAHAPFLLRVGGVELEVDGDFDAQALRRLVALLQSC